MTNNHLNRKRFAAKIWRAWRLSHVVLELSNIHKIILATDLSSPKDYHCGMELCGCCSLGTCLWISPPNPQCLCAIVIPSPVVTTHWIKEGDRMRGLVSKLLKEEGSAEGDALLTLSDHAIRFIVIKTLTEPENLAKIEVLEGSRQSKIAL